MVAPIYLILSTYLAPYYHKRNVTKNKQLTIALCLIQETKDFISIEFLALTYTSNKGQQLFNAKDLIQKSKLLHIKKVNNIYLETFVFDQVTGKMYREEKEQTFK